MKYELLKGLHDCFYTPPELPTQKQEIEECHQALSEVLGKPERRLVLQIIDAKERIAEDTSIDSFIWTACGENCIVRSTPINCM